jgi:hypothetical protein
MNMLMYIWIANATAAAHSNQNNIFRILLRSAKNEGDKSFS